MLTILSEKKRRFFYQNHLLETRPVLFEQSKEKDKMSGFTDNYIRRETALKTDFLNKTSPVKLNEINEKGLVEISFSENLVG